jgi:hypothetical protein
LETTFEYRSNRRCREIMSPQSQYSLDNDIGTEGARAIVDIVATNPSTTELFLNINDLEDEDMMLFANALRTNTDLMELHLTDSEKSTQQRVYSAHGIQLKPSLQSIQRGWQTGIGVE